MSLVVGFYFGFIDLLFYIFICGTHQFLSHKEERVLFRLILAACGSPFPNRMVLESGCVFLLLMWLR